MRPTRVHAQRARRRWRWWPVGWTTPIRAATPGCGTGWPPKGRCFRNLPAGYAPRGGASPRRNHLLAALSDVVVVIESRHGGGCDAHGLGGAGPGHPRRRRAGFDPQPDVGGNHKLLSEGCFPVCDVTDILVAVSLCRAPLPPTPSTTRSTTSSPTSSAEYVGEDRNRVDALTHDRYSTVYPFDRAALAVLWAADWSAWPVQGWSARPVEAGGNVSELA